ncbi:PEGA domain-containing protein [Planctomycetota bacterium]
MRYIILIIGLFFFVSLSGCMPATLQYPEDISMDIPYTSAPGNCLQELSYSSTAHKGGPLGHGWKELSIGHVSETISFGMFIDLSAIKSPNTVQKAVIRLRRKTFYGSEYISPRIMNVQKALTIEKGRGNRITSAKITTDKNVIEEDRGLTHGMFKEHSLTLVSWAIDQPLMNQLGVPWDFGVIVTKYPTYQYVLERWNNSNNISFKQVGSWDEVDITDALRQEVSRSHKLILLFYGNLGSDYCQMVWHSDCVDNRNLRPKVYVELGKESLQTDGDKSFPAATNNPKVNNGEGSILITSVPEGADIFLDGDFISTTPLNSLKLKQDSYKLKIVLKGFKPWEREVKILEGNKLNINARLEKE